VRLLRGCAVIVSLVVSASAVMRAQSISVGVQTARGVHTVAFETPQGMVRVYVSSDAAPGDRISGAILVEPAGVSPEDRAANLGQLDSFVMDWEGQQSPVSSRGYVWLIPIALRAGAGALSLHDSGGRLLAQAIVPIDPVPAPDQRTPSPGDTFELPTEA